MTQKLTKSDPIDVAKHTIAEAYQGLVDVSKEEALKRIENVAALPLTDTKPGELSYKVVFTTSHSAIVKVRLIKPELEPYKQEGDFYIPVDMDWETL